MEKETRCSADTRAPPWPEIKTNRNLQTVETHCGIAIAQLTFSGLQRPLQKETCMPRFIIERNFAEQVEMNKDVASAITRVNADVGVQWLFSFLSADKKKTYCLYEAPNAEALREAARKLNIPADVIIEVSEELRPEQFMQ